MKLTNPNPTSKRPLACFVTIVIPALALLLVTSCGPHSSMTVHFLTVSGAVDAKTYS